MINTDKHYDDHVIGAICACHHSCMCCAITSPSNVPHIHALFHVQPIARLGEGAFAVVEKAWYTPPGGGTKYVVAVKRLKPQMFENDEEFAMFVAEVALMRKLSHR